MRAWSFYIHKGKVYVPTTGQTPEGIWRAVEPITVVEIRDVDGLRSAFEDKLTRSLQIVPNPYADESKPAQKSGILERSGVKSWSAFEKSGEAWGIYEEHGQYILQRKKRGMPRGWIDDPASVWPLTGNNPADLAAQVAERLQT